MKNSILKYFIFALLLSSFTNYVNANPAFPTNTIPCISTATELEPEKACKTPVKGAFTLSCVETRNTTEATLTTLKQIVEKPDGYKLILKEIDKVLSNWAGETFCTDRACAYNQERLIFDVVSLFYGAGEAKALLKTGVAGNKVAKMMVEMDKTALAIVKAIRSSAVKAQKVAIGFQLAVQLNTGVFFNIGKLEAATKVLRFNTNILVSTAWPDATLVTKLDNVAYYVNENGIDVVKNGSVEIVEKNGVALARVSNVGSIVRGITKTDFFSTVADFTNPANGLLGDQAWDLWKQQKWSELETLINANGINGGWPPNNGFKNITKIETGSELSGKIFDRFQGYENLGGGFASPVNIGEGVGDLVYTYDSRALSSQIPANTFYIKFKLKNTLPSDLKFEYGEAIPWFNATGNADQIKSSLNFSNLVEGIHYDIIEKLKLVNGSWISVP